MLIDCNTCVARDIACGDCVITVLLAGPSPRTASPPARRDRSHAATGVGVDLDDAARAAIGHLASAGLVPPLRLVEPLPGVACGADAAQMSGNGREIA